MKQIITKIGVVLLASAAALTFTACDDNVVKGTMTDSRDGKTYKTVKIGTQTWMAENLNYDPGDVSRMGGHAWSGCYKDKADSCAKYGRLYTWEVAMDDASCGFGNNSCNPFGIVQGICPSGWHLPSKEEFEMLLATVGYSWKDGTENLRARSWYNGSDKFDGFSIIAGFISSSGSDQHTFSVLEIGPSLAGFADSYKYKHHAYSVRCLQD